MNMYAIEGHQVMVTEKSLESGRDYDKEKAKAFLKPKTVYTVKETNVHSWNSTVELKEFPGELFNTVHFFDTKEQSSEDDKKHKDWAFWN